MFLCHTDYFIAFPRCITWCFHFQQCPYLRVVLVSYGNLPQHVMEPSQLHRMVEEQAFHGTENEHNLSWNSNHGPTLLGA